MVGAEKPCRSCGEVRQIGDFYSHPQMSDGHLNYCKGCVKERLRIYRLNNDVVRIQEAARYRADPRKRESVDAYHARNQARLRPVRWAANIVARALRSGNLVKADSCEECGTAGVFLEGAHSDYSRPLEVRWLCRRCHRRWDAADPKSLGAAA